MGSLGLCSTFTEQEAAGLPIAAGALYQVFGLLLSPIIAAAAMALSSVASSPMPCGCAERRWSEEPIATVAFSVRAISSISALIRRAAEPASACRSVLRVCRDRPVIAGAILMLLLLFVRRFAACWGERRDGISQVREDRAIRTVIAMARLGQMSQGS